MALQRKLKHIDERPNGVLRFRRRFPKDVAEFLKQPTLQIHIRNTSGIAFHQEYHAIMREFDSHDNSPLTCPLKARRLQGPMINPHHCPNVLSQHVC